MMNEFFTKIDFKSLQKDKKKSSRRQLQIAEATIAIIYKEGLENFSYEKLAKKCKVTRSLIYHYFPLVTELLIFTSALIRYNYQMFVIAKMVDKKDLADILATYISAALQWVDVMQKEANVWLIFFHKCSVMPDLAEYNKSLVDMGNVRIASMLNAGIEQGVFKIAQEDVPRIARTIQLLITGSLVSRASEKRSQEFWIHEFKSIVKTCLLLVGVNQL